MSGSRGPIDLLLVEDDPSWADRHLAMISRQQLHVRTAATLREADELLAAHPVRFAVVDRRMPDDNGATWFHGRFLRRTIEDGVVCTSATPDEVASEKAALRVVDYIHKTSANPGDQVKRRLYHALASRSGVQRNASFDLIHACAEFALNRALTVRNLDVLIRRTTGMSTEGTALDLGLSIATVDTHWRACRRPDRIASEAEMVRFLLSSPFAATDLAGAAE